MIKPVVAIALALFATAGLAQSDPARPVIADAIDIGQWDTHVGQYQV